MFPIWSIQTLKIKCISKRRAKDWSTACCKKVKFTAMLSSSLHVRKQKETKPETYCLAPNALHSEATYDWLAKVNWQNRAASVQLVKHHCRKCAYLVWVWWKSLANCPYCQLTGSFMAPQSPATNLRHQCLTQLGLLAQQWTFLTMATLLEASPLLEPNSCQNTAVATLQKWLIWRQNVPPQNELVPTKQVGGTGHNAGRGEYAPHR